MWSFVSVESLNLANSSNSSISFNFSCIPSISPDQSSCFGHGDCIVVFDSSTVIGNQLVNQSTSQSRLISDISVDLYGITDEILPVSVCHCHAEYDVRPDIVRFDAVHHLGCAVSKQEVEVAMILALIMYSILAIFSLYKMMEWYRTSKYSIQRLSRLSLARPKSHIARALRLSHSHLSPNHSVDEKVAPIDRVKMVEMMSQIPKPDSPMANVKRTRLRATQSESMSARPSSRARQSSVSASSPNPSNSQNNESIDPLTIGLFIRSQPVEEAPRARSHPSKQAINKPNLANKLPIIRPGIPPITSSALWKKYCQQLEFLIPCLCFITGLSGVLFYLTYLSTNLVMLHDWELSLMYYIIYLFGYSYMSLSAFNTIKLRASVTSGSAYLTVRGARNGKKAIVCLLFIQASTSTILFIAISSSMNQNVCAILLATFCLTPFYALTTFSVWTLYRTSTELKKGMVTLNQQQQQDRTRVITSLKRHGTWLAVIALVLFLTSLLFVCVPYMIVHRRLYLVIQAGLFCGSGTARMRLLRSAQFERVQPLGAIMPIGSIHPLNNQRNKRKSAVAPGPSSHQHMNANQPSNQPISTINPHHARSNSDVPAFDQLALPMQTHKQLTMHMSI